VPTEEWGKKVKNGGIGLYFDWELLWPKPPKVFTYLSLDVGSLPNEEYYLGVGDFSRFPSLAGVGGEYKQRML
jgi:hypothetical protein